jgi:hypothetical protein
MKWDVRYIVEVELHDSLNRAQKSRIIGVWRNAEDVPVERIRAINQRVHPTKEIEIKIHPYSGLF